MSVTLQIYIVQNIIYGVLGFTFEICARCCCSIAYNCGVSSLIMIVTSILMSKY